MFKEYNDNDFIISYQDNLEKLVTNFVSYYKKSINALLNKFHLDSTNKLEIRLFSDKSLLGDIPYKLGDFAGFFNDKGVSCYININGNKSESYIIKAIMHEIVHHIYRYYIEDDVDNRVIWFDEGLAMNFSLQNDKYNNEDNFKEFLNNRVFNIVNIPRINDLEHGSDFVNENYNGYDLAYLVVKYLIENNSDEDFYLIMKSKKVIKGIGENILNIAINYYYNIYKD
mgnify:CR=1 FL=1